jgi:flagellar biogenesis protein FliO
MFAHVAASLSPELPLRRDADADTAFPAGALVLLVAVLAAAVAWAWWRDRRSAGAWSWRRALRLPEASTRLRVVASLRLDARTSVHVLEWEGSRLLVARGEQAVTLLAERRGELGEGSPSPGKGAS